MRGIKLIALLLLTIPLLWGCSESSKSYKELKLEIDDYNTLVGDTLFAFSTLKATVKDKEDEILDYVLENVATGLVSDDLALEPLLDTELQLFGNRSIIYNDFYTALGSSTVRQVIVIKGKDEKLMSIKIIWGEDGIVDIKRELRDL